MNFGCYFAGVLAALIYDHLVNQHFKLHKSIWFQILWYSLIPAGVLWIFSIHPIYQDYFDEIPTVVSCVYAAIQRNAWGIGLGIFIIGMACKVGCKTFSTNMYYKVELVLFL